MKKKKKQTKQSKAKQNEAKNSLKIKEKLFSGQETAIKSKELL